MQVGPIVIGCFNIIEVACRDRGGLGADVSIQQNMKIQRIFLVFKILGNLHIFGPSEQAIGANKSMVKLSGSLQGIVCFDCKHSIPRLKHVDPVGCIAQKKPVTNVSMSMSSQFSTIIDVTFDKILEPCSTLKEQVEIVNSSEVPLVIGDHNMLEAWEGMSPWET